MSKRFFYLLLLFLGINASISAQKGFFTGIVTDKATGEPLIAATVSSKDVGVVTDFDGSFELALEPGKHEVEFRYIGYELFVSTIDIKAGEEQRIRVALNQESNILNTATVTSGKYEKKLGEVTVSLEVLQPQLIENTSKPTLDKAIEKIPGVTIIDGQANIRGGSGYSQGAGSRVLLLVDDIPILQPDAGFPNWDDVPVENISQVEVLKGAASALYGSSALNGIVNVRTAYAKSEPETTISTFFTHYFNPATEDFAWWNEEGEGTPYTFATSAVHRRKIDKLDLVLGGFYFNEESFNQDTYRKFGRFNFSTRYRLNDRLSFGVNGNINYGSAGSFFYWADPSTPFVGDSTSVATRERNRYNIDPFITYYDKSGSRHKFQGRFLRVDNDNSDNQSNSSSSSYGEYQFQRKLDDIGLVITAGAVALQSNISAELYGDTTFTSLNLGAYLQLEKKLFERLNVSAGVRYEYNRLDNPGFAVDQVVVDPSEEEDSRPVFRLGANYQLTDYTFIRASWGQGYRFPSIAEKFIFTNAGAITVVPNPDLEFETGWTAEIGIKQGFKLGGFQGFVDIAAFTSEYDNMVEFNFGFTEFGIGFSAVNIGATEITGGEFTIAGQGTLGDMPFNVLAGYTYIDPTFKEWDTEVDDFFNPTEGETNFLNSSTQENILKYRSRHLIKADVELEPFKNFRFGVEYFYNSFMEAIDGVLETVIVPGLGDFRDQNPNGFNVVSFRSSYQFDFGLKTSVILGNALNEEYTSRPGLMDAPRNLTVRFDYEF
ncbi:MAG: TonB-dependent receptor [Bacteroidota bacterium]